MSQEAFVTALGVVFEDTPAIAHYSWYKRPFETKLCSNIVVETDTGTPQQ